MTFTDKVKFVRMKLYLSQAQLASVGRFNDFCEKHGITFEEKGETHHG